MLRDAETTSIAERMRCSPVGGDALSRRRGGGLASFFFFFRRLKHNYFALFLKKAHEYYRIYQTIDKQCKAPTKGAPSQTCFQPRLRVRKHVSIIPAEFRRCNICGLSRPQRADAPDFSPVLRDAAPAPWLPPPLIIDHVGAAARIAGRLQRPARRAI